MAGRAKSNPQIAKSVIQGQSMTPQDAVDCLLQSGPWVAVTAAIKLLKGCNYNLAADCVRALTQEGRGKVFRIGRDLTVVLPERWEESKDV